VPQSQKKRPATPGPQKLAPGPDVVSKTPMQQKAPLSQKKVVIATPVSERAPGTAQKKRPATPGPPKAQATPTQGPATPRPTKAAPATPGPLKAPATPGPAKVMATPGKKKAGGATPKTQLQIPSSNLSPLASHQTPTSGLKKVRAAKSTQKRQ